MNQTLKRNHRSIPVIIRKRSVKWIHAHCSIMVVTKMKDLIHHHLHPVRAGNNLPTELLK